MIRAVGVMFVSPESNTLLLRRTAEGDLQGTWAFPGGKIEGSEDELDALERECNEEIGFYPTGHKPMLWTRRIKNGVDYSTYLQRVENEFDPVLNSEHDEFHWESIKELIDQAADPALVDQLFMERERLQ